MPNGSLWEALLAGVVAVLVILWFRPGLRNALELSRTAPKDWPGFLLPLGLVVLFVLLLIASLR